jgi:5-methylcytosine-specific restriction endonuclease McrA
VNPGTAKKKFHKRNGRHCWYCGVKVALDKRAKNGKETLATVDHQIPLSQGGTDSRQNKVTACTACNHEKADMTVDEYRVFLMRKNQNGYEKFYGESPA